MKLIKTEDAIGQVLSHDVTRIVKGVVKDRAFKKGHVITKEDIPLLLQLGKDHIYIWENDESMMHENDAAEVLVKISKGSNMHESEVKEGKIELIADTDGFLSVDIENLRKINSFGDMMIATLPSGFMVKKGEKLAAMRVIPLVIKKDRMKEAENVTSTPIINVMPFKSVKYGVVTTGNEVFNKRIEDTFTPTIVEKMNEYNSEMIVHEITDDNNENIEKAITKMINNKDVEMIICTGGMSVDPDDKTPLAIKNVGANIITYGAPVVPGAMFLMGYLKDGRPICGLPGCVMYMKRTIFDLALVRIMAGVKVTKEFIYGLGHGGYCRSCSVCHFPNCSFGKGI